MQRCQSIWSAADPRWNGWLYAANATAWVEPQGLQNERENRLLLGSADPFDYVGGCRPKRPRADETGVVEYVRDLTSRNGLQMSDAAMLAWKGFEDRLTSPFWPSPAARSLRLEPHAQDSVPPRFQGAHIDVALRGVNGKSSLYRLCDVTGVDERVQAVVASQEATASCLLVAFERIEEEDMHEFSFVCHGATHRSLACSLLLAAIAYPRATVHMTTRRTRRAAALAYLFEQPGQPSASS